MDRGTRATGHVEGKSGRGPRGREAGANKNGRGAGKRVEGVGGQDEWRRWWGDG